MLEQVERKTHENRVGVELHRDGWCLGTWIDAEWDGESPRSKLFAAAPELLEALKNLTKKAEAWGQLAECRANLAGPIKAARDDIAKAEGGAS